MIENHNIGGGKVKQATVSFVKGKGNVNHNNRKFLTDNIDKDRVKDNIIYIQKDLREFYKEIFQNEVDQYNLKQKRADRKIDSYYDKIAKSKQENLFYEVVVQVGDKDFSDKSSATKVLNDYMINFEKRNPTLKVFNAVMHLDEESPHLHIDFVPVAEGYKKGLSKRNSISKALGGQMVDWYEKEREHIKGLAATRNIEIIKKNEPKRAYIPIIEYKALKESSKYVLDAFKGNIKHMEDMNDGFTEYKLKYNNAEERIEHTIKSSSKYSKGILGTPGSYHIPENKMYELTGTLLRQFLGDDYKLFTNKAEKLISSYDFDENKLMQNLTENKDLFKQINELELENKRLKQVEKDYNLLKSEFNCEKERIEKIAQEKYKNEIQQANKISKTYKEIFKSLNSDFNELLNTFEKYDLAEVVEEKKKNEIKHRNKNREIDM